MKATKDLPKKMRWIGAGSSGWLLRVVTYHRVAEPDPDAGMDPRLVSATPENFARQMQFLARHYRVLDMQEVLDAVRNNSPLPARAVLITFDDAYRDFLENAWPVLQKYNLPVTVFVPTSFPGEPERAFWWDRLYAAMMFSHRTELENSPVGALALTNAEARLQSMRAVQARIKLMPHEDAMRSIDEICAGLLNGQPENRGYVLNWDELRRLVAAGVTLAPHTRSHPILTRLPLLQAQTEIAGSIADLKQEIGQVLPVFAYPNGSHNAAILAILRQEGIQLAFNGPGGHNILGQTDPLALRRLNITRRTTAAIFRLRLLRSFSYLEMWRHRRRARMLSGQTEEPDEITTG